MKMFQKLAGTLAAGALILAGCGVTNEPVTVDKAPSDLLKKVAAINSESKAADLATVFEGIIDETYKTNGGRLILSETASGTGIDANSDQLASVTNNFQSYDVRYGTSDAFYQLYEEEGLDKPVYGLMASTSQGLTTVFTKLDGSSLGNPQGKMTVESIDKKEEKPQTSDFSSYVKNSVIYPFYTMLGSTLVLQPAYTPQHYSYALTRTGQNYIWTISIKDHEAYNKALDETFKQYYRHDRTDIKGDGSLVVDEYDVSEVTLTLTMDANGCLKKIVNTNKSTVKQGTTSLALSTSDTVNIKQADETWGAFFGEFFKRIGDGQLKKDDSFQLNQTFESKDSQSSQKAKEDSAAKSESKTDAKADSSADKKENSASESNSAKTSTSPSKTSESSEKK